LVFLLTDNGSPMPAKTVTGSYELTVVCPTETMNLAFTALSHDLDGQVLLESTGSTMNINWGDGSSEPINGFLTHSYSSAGNKNISVSGCLQDITKINLLQDPYHLHGYSFFSGSLPDLSSLTSLESLNLTVNKFSGTLPVGAFDNNLDLVELDLSENNFSGSLPIGIFENNLSLEVLNLALNQFSGSIAVELIENNTNLKTIYLSANQFSGSIPLGIFDNNTDLEILGLGFNNLSGALPAGIFNNNVNLFSISLKGNQLSGSLPAGIFDNNLVLSSLSLHSNQFSGSLPSSIFDNNLLLSKLFINDNQFTNGVDLHNHTEMVFLYAHNNNFNVSSINNFLIDVDTSGAPVSIVRVQGQSPSAPPSGSGVTAKNNLISSGVTVLTD